MYADGYFKVDPDTWTASSALTSQGGYETADLASSNVLFTKTNTGSGLFISKSQEYLKKIRIYPNPVMEDVVSIQFNHLPPGDYTIQMANFLGKVLIQQKANISGQSQTVTMHIPGYTLQGFYYIRVLDEKNIVVGLEKLAVERW